MKKILTLFGQMHANLIIKKMSKCETQEDIDYWYNRGLQLNDFFISMDIYLD